jgi:nucleotide-binding universal stress UspA family protein
MDPSRAIALDARVRAEAPDLPVVATAASADGPSNDAVGVSEPLRRILFATDLSTASDVAAGEAIRLALEHGAQLIVMTVIDPGRLRLPGGRFLRRIDQERARVQSETQVLVARARAAGARATFLVWEGDPAESIVAASEAEQADAIVLGSHGRGLLGRLVLGSTSARVAEDARCHVFVFPAA